jgi:hypothetical protein
MGREWVSEGEYGANMVYTCMKMENETCQNYSRSWGEIKKNDGEKEYIQHEIL